MAPAAKSPLAPFTVERREPGEHDVAIEILHCLDTISAPHHCDKYLGMLRPQRVMVVVGVPPEPTPVSAFSLIGGSKRLAGSRIGGIAETQEVLDYCAEHGIVSDIEVIPIQRINEAYERMLKADVRYRFVRDIASLTAS